MCLKKKFFTRCRRTFVVLIPTIILFGWARKDSGLPEVYLQEHHNGNSTAFICVSRKENTVAGWVALCPYDEHARSTLLDLGPCAPHTLLISDLYIAPSYRKKGLTSCLVNATVTCAKQTGFTHLIWVAQPYEITQLPTGIFGDYQEFTDDQTYQHHLQKLIRLYTSIGARPRKKPDGSLLLVPGPRPGAPGILFTLSLADYVPPTSSH